MARTFVGLGSNLGDRIHFLQRAVDDLATLPQTRLVACSSVYKTEPVGRKEQPEFLNAVVELESSLSPTELFAELKNVERKLGRSHAERWGPREIDLDLLYSGDSIIIDDVLTIPHAEAPNRRFVLVPLKEIAGEFVDPVRKLSVAELLKVCPDTSAVRKTELTLLVHP